MKRMQFLFYILPHNNEKDNLQIYNSKQNTTHITVQLRAKRINQLCDDVHTKYRNGCSVVNSEA